MTAMKKSNERQRNVFGSPGLRLLQLYMLLHSGRRAYSLTRLAGLFRCSRQSILRMVEQLQLVGNGQVRTWVQRGERFYQAVPEPAPACIALNPGSLSQLLLCRDMVRHLLSKSIQDEISASLGTVRTTVWFREGLPHHAKPVVFASAYMRSSKCRSKRTLCPSSKAEGIPAVSGSVIPHGDCHKAIALL